MFLEAYTKSEVQLCTQGLVSKASVPECIKKHIIVTITTAAVSGGGGGGQTAAWLYRKNLHYILGGDPQEVLDFPQIKTNKHNCLTTTTTCVLCMSQVWYSRGNLPALSATCDMAMDQRRHVCGRYLIIVSGLYASILRCSLHINSCV